MAEDLKTNAQVSKRFNAPDEQVFDAWLDPETMRQWLFTSPESDTPAEIEHDPQTGGTWRIKDRREGEEFEADGEYVEIDRPRRLVFTFRMPQFSESVDKIVVDIEPSDSGSHMTLAQEMVLPGDIGIPDDHREAALEEFRKATEQGWATMFDNLAVALDTQET